jgi:hypothetical protein
MAAVSEYTVRKYTQSRTITSVFCQCSSKTSPEELGNLQFGKYERTRVG